MPAKLIYLKDFSSERFAKTFLELVNKGDVPLCLPSKLSREQLDHYLNQNIGIGLMKDGKLVRESTAVSPHENCYGTLTSGTTSEPKICYLSIERAKANAKAHASSIKLTSDQTILQALPIYHSFGIMNYIWLPLINHNKIKYHDGMLGLKSINKMEENSFYLAISPSQLRFFLKEKTSTDKIHTLSIGGGLAYKKELLAIKEKLSCPVYVTYGLSEAGPRVSTAEVGDHYEEGSLGHPLDGISVKCNSNQQLLIKTPYEKLNMLEEEKDGEYLITRDQVELQHDKIIFKQRVDDLIDFGGVSIYPRDIEKVALEHDSVEDALVMAQSHPLHGEVPILFVQSQETNDESLIDEYLVEKILPYQRPFKILFYQSFPRTSLGKVDRKKLKESLK